MRVDPWGSFVPTLLRALGMRGIRGPVLELGGGAYSTPVLHEMCREDGVVTVEADETWAAQVRRYEAPHHRVLCRPYFSDARGPVWEETGGFGAPWSLVFIDPAPASVRMPLALACAEVCPLVVLHDTEPRVRSEYGWDFSAFKYVAHDDRLEPWTSIVSQHRSVEL